MKQSESTGEEGHGVPTGIVSELYLLHTLSEDEVK